MFDNKWKVLSLTIVPSFGGASRVNGFRVVVEDGEKKVESWFPKMMGKKKKKKKTRKRGGVVKVRVRASRLAAYASS